MEYEKEKIKAGANEDGRWREFEKNEWRRIPECERKRNSSVLGKKKNSSSNATELKYFLTIKYRKEHLPFQGKIKVTLSSSRRKFISDIVATSDWERIRTIFNAKI